MRVPPGLGSYLLWQVPGWCGAALVLWLLHAMVDLPGWIAGSILTLYVLKDLAMFPVMRHAFAPSRTGELVGARGRTVEPLAPAGYVRVGGELWKAEAASPDQVIATGAAVAVRATRGLTLIVEEEEGR